MPRDLSLSASGPLDERQRDHDGDQATEIDDNVKQIGEGHRPECSEPHRKATTGWGSEPIRRAASQSAVTTSAIEPSEFLP